jgi:hypothetical protein
MRHQRRGCLNLVLCSIGAGIFLGGCGQPDGDDNEVVAASGLSEAEPPTLPVVGGEAGPVCGFPMTAKIPGCTASLLTPTLLVTARHCGPKAGMIVQFGEKAPFAFSVKATKCVTATNSDAAYCVLPDDPNLKMVPTVPVLHGCEYTKFMKVGARLAGVGFGQTQGTGPARTKNAVEVPVARVRDPFIDVGDKTHDLCFGDSGGGAYIHLVEGDKDWGWRLVGTVTGTARGVGGPCGGTDYTTILRHIALIEQNEKIDITPCTDEKGAWAPGPECKDFLTDIGTGGGAWPACNSGPRTTLPIDSCGAGPGPAPGAPGEGAAGRDAGAGNAGGSGGAGAEGGAGGGSPAGGSGGSGSGGAVARDAGSLAGGSGGSPGAGGSTGVAGSGGKSLDAGTAGPGGVAGGCGCDLGGKGGRRTTAPALALIAFVLFKRRRRAAHLAAMARR